MDIYIQYWAFFFVTASFSIEIFKQAIMYFGDLSKIMMTRVKVGIINNLAAFSEVFFCLTDFYSLHLCFLRASNSFILTDTDIALYNHHATISRDSFFQTTYCLPTAHPKFETFEKWEQACHDPTILTTEEKQRLLNRFPYDDANKLCWQRTGLFFDQLISKAAAATDGRGLKHREIDVLSHGPWGGFKPPGHSIVESHEVDPW